MPNHPPKTLSYKDVLFILETLINAKMFVIPEYKFTHQDIDRCIKILEKDDE